MIDCIESIFIYLQRTEKGSVFNRLKFMLVQLANRTFSCVSECYAMCGPLIGYI